METVGFDTVRAGKGAADMSKGKDPLSARDWATADAYIAGHAEATPLQMLEPQSFFVDSRREVRNCVCPGAGGSPATVSLRPSTR